MNDKESLLPNCVEYAKAQEEIERQWKERHRKEFIPVEWLEDKINMYDYLANHSEGIWAERYDEWAHLLSQMIEKWRRENEG